MIEGLMSTFSIAAYDKQRREWGVAMQSKFLACASIVPWAKAGVGAIATQARANYQYGPDGLGMLADGLSADEVVDRLTAADDGRELRQLAVIDSSGAASAYTGKSCLYWAGHRSSEGVSCQGNILAGPDVVDAMMDAFLESPGDLAERMIASLEAAESQGGDWRGRQSSGILVVRDGGGFGGLCDRYIDLRVDDHPEPISELRRVVSLHRLTFAQAHSGRLYRLDPTVRGVLCDWLRRLGSDPADGSDLCSALSEHVELGASSEEWIDGSSVLALRQKVQSSFERELAQLPHSSEVFY